MTKVLSPGPRSGGVTAPPSKSHAQRLLLCAAAGERECRVFCGDISRDVAAMAECLNALGADIREVEPGTLRVRPIQREPQAVCRLPCGESGAVLRFLLPFVGAIGARALFQREGRLPLRPLEPLDEQLRSHGMKLEERADELFCEGTLQPGEFVLPGDVSSQFISGLLMALPLLPGESRLRVTGPIESSAYVNMTEETLRLAGISFFHSIDTYTIPGSEHPQLPGVIGVEGDWSGAAAFLCMGAMSAAGVAVRGLDLDSVQGDRAILDLLRGFGAEVSVREERVLVRRHVLRGQEIDGAQIPDLIPPLCALAALAEGETRIRNAARLRLKESDRLRSVASMLRALGAEIMELPDGLLIRGTPQLRGGTVDCAADHRIVMTVAVAACGCAETVTVKDPACVEKSYPGFWEDWEGLRRETR